MKALVLTFFDDDREVINDYVQSLRKKTPAKLIDAYNREHKIGITGVRRQGLYLYSLHKVFKERFGESPIMLDNSVLELTDPISMVDGKIRFLEENPYQLRETPELPSEQILKACKKVEYIPQPALHFVFFCLVIRIDSVLRIHGDLPSFVEEHMPRGSVNKQLLIMSSMSCPGPEIGGLIVDVLGPKGYITNEDYAVIQEDPPMRHVEGRTRYVSLPNMSCKDVPWLGSVVTDGGNFIWFREQSRK